MEPVDEYTLASFMAGTLSPQRRAEVVQYLAEHEDARELLRMSYLALDAARHGTAVPPPAQRIAPAPDRAPSPRQQPVRRIPHIAALAVLVVSVGIGLRLFVFPPSDQFRTGASDSATSVLAPRIASDLSMRWKALPEADRYEIMVWDELNAEVVAETSARATNTEPDAPFTRTLAATLQPGRLYMVRIDAFDAENRLLASSEMVPLKR